ncbi:MAG: excinuclease ABC subunit UvrA [Bacteroidetes bacterium]|nr:excinuclease ABC subunit UvrA [Bacteroidota bacterium]
MSDSILIKGAKTHNLKNIDVEIPRGKMVVVTGVSGSGKSSLTIDTLFAEGQRRYVESLSSYARQFLSRINKPDVEYIKGICPAIAIEQKVSTTTTRSTVGTLTEIYDYLRLLYARIGITYSPVSGSIVKKDEVTDVIDFLKKQKKGDKIFILCAHAIQKKIEQELELLQQKGFQRVVSNGEVYKIEDALVDKKFIGKKHKSIDIVIDRLVWEDTEEMQMRAGDSVQTAFDESLGECSIWLQESNKTKDFNNRFELDGMSFEQPSIHLFNFNNSFGACKRCEGYGTVLDLDPDLIIPDKSLSVCEGCVAAWKGEKMSEWLDDFVLKSMHFDFPIHRPYSELNMEEKELLWKGAKGLKGISDFFKMVESNSYKIQYRVMLSRYKGRTTCPDCFGSRVRKDAHYVKIDNKSIGELLHIPIKDLLVYFKSIKLTKYQEQVSIRILTEIRNRLQFMMDVGLGYLTLNRFSNSLSGGESQRINLTRSLGSNLTNSLYILDEPSIGLHPRDTARLIGVLKELQKLGNTVVIVEHEEDIMKGADHIIDIGPYAGVHGGNIVFEGTYKEILKDKKSLTGQFLSGKETIDIPKHIRKPIMSIEIIGAQHHNLKNIDVKIPLNCITAVSGVSGSGKTTLIKKILYPALKRELGQIAEKPGNFKAIQGDIKKIKDIELIDQNPLGRSSRSNPITYIKAYDYIRDLYADLQASKIKGLKPKAFSFNVEGGRCEACKGDGVQLVEMQFLADVELECESCKGKRFKEEVLEVQFNNKNIFEVLDMTVDESIEFFSSKPNIADRIKPLQDVGLGYIKLGQSSSTLSGGEAQRVKLASYLQKGTTNQPILFIFDEPTTGLHFYDIKKLLKAMNDLVEIGHTIVIIEHNMEVIKSADWLIDLGPKGGDLGGNLLYQGPPQGILKVKESYTAQFLKEKLNS